MATFTPTANLAASTQYTATITNAAKDLSGNALVAGAVPNPWSFTTGAGPEYDSANDNSHQSCECRHQRSAQRER